MLGGGGAAAYFFVLDQDLANLSKYGITIFGDNRDKGDKDADDEEATEKEDGDELNTDDDEDLNDLDEEDGTVASFDKVMGEKLNELMESEAEVMYTDETPDNPRVLYLKDTHLYEFVAKTKTTEEVDLEKLDPNARVLFGGSENGIRSWVYDETTNTITLKVQTYGTNGKTGGIGEYVLNPVDMTLKVVKDGKQPQKPQRPQNTQPQNSGTGFHLERI